MNSHSSIHAGGASFDARYCEAGPHSFVSVTADYASIHATRDGLSVDVGGPVSLYVSPANARAIAERILAALPDEAAADEQEVEVAA